MTDLRKNSWNSFRKSLAGSGYTQQELSDLYRMHQTGHIKFWELKKPQNLKKYLNKSKKLDFDDIKDKIANKISKRRSPVFYIDIAKYDDAEASRLMLWIEDSKPSIIADYLTKEYIKIFKMDDKDLLNYKNKELTYETLCFYLALLKLYELFYDLAERLISLGNTKIGYLMFLVYAYDGNFRLFLDKILGKNEADFYAIKLLLKSSESSDKTNQADETLYDIETVDYLKLYDKKYEKLETECEQYKNKLAKLERQIIKLKYAPGGPEFKKLQNIAVRRGMKK